MSKENILSIISVLLSIAILVFASYILFSLRGKNTERDVPQNDVKKEDYTQSNDVQVKQQDPTQQKEFIHSAWIPAFDFMNGFQSLKIHKDLIKEVNPVLYTVNSDGTLAISKPDEKAFQDFLTFCSANDIKVVPTVGSYDYKVMENVLSSQVYIEKNISEIVNEVNKYGYSGIDIDYERIKTSQKDGYLLFLRDLNTELKKSNKRLSVTVFAKTRDSFTDTLFVQDWKEIADIADMVKIMGYDYTLQTSTIPGPIGPMDWIQEVIKYSSGKIPSEKISLGIHLYAYLWKGEKASALTYSSVLNILNNSNIQKEYKKDIEEGYVKYTCSDGSQCVLFYQTPEGVSARVKFAQDTHLGGVSYWRLGGDENILNSNPGLQGR